MMEEAFIFDGHDRLRDIGGQVFQVHLRLAGAALCRPARQALGFQAPRWLGAVIRKGFDFIRA